MGGDRYLRTRAIPLGARPRGEADRIVVLLTEARGKVHALAKGVRRTTSRYGGAFELAVLLDLRLYRKPGADLFTATEAQILDARSGLRTAYAPLAAAQRIAEWLDRLLPAEHPEPEAFALAEFTFGRLAAAGDPPLALRVFEVRLARILGWGLDPDGEEAARLRLAPGARRFLAAAAEDPLERTLRYRLTPETSRQLARALERHLHLTAESAPRRSEPA